MLPETTNLVGGLCQPLWKNMSQIGKNFLQIGVNRKEHMRKNTTINPHLLSHQPTSVIPSTHSCRLTKVIENQTSTWIAIVYCQVSWVWIGVEETKFASVTTERPETGVLSANGVWIKTNHLRLKGGGLILTARKRLCCRLFGVVLYSYWKDLKIWNNSF